MATNFYKRLTEKYNENDVRGQKYQALINEIVARNSEKAARAVGRLNNESYLKSLKRIPKDRAKTVKLPDLSEVLPKQSVFAIKGAQSGTILTEKVRDSLNQDLRKTLDDFSGQKMEIQRGKTTGKINPALIEAFKGRIRQTLSPYTKGSPQHRGRPPQIDAIATTEIRSTVNMIKEEYSTNLLKNNSQLEGTKTWIHNVRMSKVPRWNHKAMDGVTIKQSEMFQVPRDGGGFDLMSRPHDPNGGAKQIISCHCDFVTKISFKKEAS